MGEREEDSSLSFRVSFSLSLSLSLLLPPIDLKSTTFASKCTHEPPPPLLLFPLIFEIHYFPPRFGCQQSPCFECTDWIFCSSPSLFLIFSLLSRGRYTGTWELGRGERRGTPCTGIRMLMKSVMYGICTTMQRRGPLAPLSFFGPWIADLN